MPSSKGVLLSLLVVLLTATNHGVTANRNNGEATPRNKVHCCDNDSCSSCTDRDFKVCFERYPYYLEGNLCIPTGNRKYSIGVECRRIAV